eukprot:gnl/Trimastix_PCT/2876.p1 GENE.gnl/Trimastix_PCT/2876~~gnl/Trimastix_PCT/2876.p1  ORF type:complete len:413 (+),score=55.24 gnl/Trimastix_PCT/2876:8-1246(+)
MALRGGLIVTLMSSLDAFFAKKTRKRASNKSIKTWSLGHLAGQGQAAPPVEMTNVSAVSSYEWPCEEPIIHVPGTPPEYRNPAIGQQMERSVVTNLPKNHADKNRRMLPDQPMEPLFRSISLCAPAFDQSQVSVYSDRHNLRQLAFIGTGIVKKDFMMDIYRPTPGMLVLIRNDALLPPPFPGFGDSFERACIKRILAGASFRNMNHFHLGPHRIIIRSEVDCMQIASNAGVQSVTRSMASMSLGNEQQVPDSLLRYVVTGGRVPCSPEWIPVELKSRNENHYAQFDFTDLWLQMRLGSVERAVLGLHQHGRLNTVKHLSLVQVEARSSSPARLLSSLACMLSILQETLADRPSAERTFRLRGWKDRPQIILERASFPPPMAPSSEALLTGQRPQHRGVGRHGFRQRDAVRA